MNEHDQQVSSVEATANLTPSQGRRRLVKGAMLATPAVMTLMSGRLMAAVSLTCPQKNVIPQVGWTNQPGELVLVNDSKYGFGYYYSESGVTKFQSVDPTVAQDAFHSATCWNSAYPSQG